LARKPKGSFFGGRLQFTTQTRQNQIQRSCKQLIAQRLGICYGVSVFARGLWLRRASPNREYGYARLKVVDVTSRLFQGLPPEMDVWMSHGDHVTENTRLVLGDCVN